MATIPRNARLVAKKNTRHKGLARMARYLKLIFFSGPKVLLTSRISGKCAFIMVLMCSPALLASFILTVPGLVFQSPYQHAYFYFSSALNEDPTRWITLILAGICALLSLAVPANMSERRQPIRY